MASRLPATVIAFVLLVSALALASPDDENMPGKIAVIRGPGTTWASG